MHLSLPPYQIILFTDNEHNPASVDNVHSYEQVYIEDSEYRISNQIGIQVVEDDNQIATAIIGSTGWATVIGSQSLVLEPNRMVICCGDTVFCLSVPHLQLLWKTQADDYTCFNIYPYQDNYIIHGEMSISRLDCNGKIVWQHSGADIFVSIDGDSKLQLSDDFIEVRDFENRVYKFGYDGENLTDMSQFKK